MSDRTSVIQCRGGVNEDGAEVEVKAGRVRRSSNYEQVSEGGYRQIEGSERWSGVDTLPDKRRLSVAEVGAGSFQGPFTISVGRLIAYPFPGNVRTTSLSNTEIKILMSISRENSEIVVIEKVEPSSYLLPGENLLNGSASVISENVSLTDAERLSISTALNSATGDGIEPRGAGEIHLLHGVDSKDFDAHVLTARRTGNDVALQYSKRISSFGNWQLAGNYTVPSGGQWAAISYQFLAKDASTYIVTGTSNLIIYNHATNSSKELAVAAGGLFPTHIIAHQNHLFLGYENGSVIHSDLGDPETFSAIGGGSEINTGSAITGFQILPGESLAIFGEDKISILSGSSSGNWDLNVHSTQVGAISGSIQDLPTAIFCTSRGISTLAASDRYGDFADNTLSHLFDRLYQKIRQGSRLFSVVNREKSQYRIFNDNGIGLYLTFASGKLVGAMEVDLKQKITAVGAIDGDVERTFYAGADGFVHRLDAGNTLSGQDLESYIEFPYHHYGSPRQKKRIKQVVLDMRGDSLTKLNITSTVDRGQGFHCDPEPIKADNIVRVRDRREDSLSHLNDRYQSIAYLAGTGFDHSLRIDPAIATAHEIESVTIHYTYRGQKR